MKVEGNKRVMRFLLHYTEKLCRGEVLRGFDAIFWLNRYNRTVYYMSYDSYISGNIQGYPISHYSDDYSYLIDGEGEDLK